jgi:hypothetical protein
MEKIFHGILILILATGISPQEEKKDGIKVEAISHEFKDSHRIIASGVADLPDGAVVLLTIYKNWQKKLDDKEILKDLKNWYENLGMENKWYWRMHVKNKKFRMDKRGFPKHTFWAGDYLVKVVVKRWDQPFHLRDKIAQEQYKYIGQTILKIGRTGEISDYLKKEIPKMMEHYKEGKGLISQLEELLIIDKKSGVGRLRDKKKGQKLLERLQKFVRALTLYQYGAHGPYNKVRLAYTMRKFYNIFSLLSSQLEQELHPPKVAPGPRRRQGVEIAKAKSGFEESKKIFCHEFFFLQRFEELKLLKEDWEELLLKEQSSEKYRKRLSLLKKSLGKIRDAHLQMEGLKDPSWEPYKRLAGRKDNLKDDLKLMWETILLLEKEDFLREKGEDLQIQEKKRLEELLARLKKRLQEEKKKK